MKRILVKVKPSAKREEVTELSPGNFAVAVREPAREGKANHAVLKAIAEYFGIAASRARLVSGRTSRNKILEIT